MKNKGKRLGVLLLCMALLFMQNLKVEAGGSDSSASDFKMEGTELVKYKGTSKSVSVPVGVESIAREAFEENDKITKLSLPKTLKVIDAYAFWGCDNLSSVSLGSGLKTVGDYVFTNCKGLTEISLPSNIRSIGIQAFADCTNLRVIKIPPEVTDIHETAFDGCVNLIIDCEEGSYADKYAEDFYERQKDMPNYPVDTLPEEDDEKEDEPGKEEITVPVTDGELLGATQVVGNSAFVIMDTEGHRILDGELIQQTILDNAGLQFQGKVNQNYAKYTIVDGEIVADQAYYGSQELGYLELPLTVKEIGQFAFARSSLRKLVIPEGVEKISYGAFYGCDGLVSVVLPKSIKSIEPKAIEGTAYYENFMNQNRTDFLISEHCLLAYKGDSSKVVIPDGVQVIAAEVFRDHTEIKTVQFPEGLISIGEGAFQNCSKLSKVTFNDELEEIKDRAFYGTVLKAAAIPASVRAVGLKAFPTKTILRYRGELPGESYEYTAQRINNASYRDIIEEPDEKKLIHIKGMEKALAVMEELERPYYLTIESKVSDDDFRKAYDRLQLVQPDQFAGVYRLYFTDSSGIPLTKLGGRLLTVLLPLTEDVAKKELHMVTLDRNGQLESVPCDRVRMDGEPYIRFVTEFISSYAIVASEQNYSGNEMLLEGTVSLRQMAATPGTDPYRIVNPISEILLDEEEQPVSVSGTNTMLWAGLGGCLLLLLIVTARLGRKRK